VFYIKMADLTICINNRYKYTEKMCSDYIIEMTSQIKCDMKIEVSMEDIIKEQEESGYPYPLDYCESICIYRAISKKLIKYDGFLMHGACVEMDGEVYVFCAKSGTGKSTHLNLWKQVYGEKARIINGDKPIIRKINDRFTVYGTPWCGKEGYNINTSAPLKAICFLERGINNHIESIKPADVMKRLVHQILMPVIQADMMAYLDMMDKLINDTPAYLLKCNMDKEAAVVAYNGMNSHT